MDNDARVRSLAHSAYDLMTETGARLTMSWCILFTLVVLQVWDSQGTGILL